MNRPHLRFPDRLAPRARLTLLVACAAGVGPASWASHALAQIDRQIDRQSTGQDANARVEALPPPTAQPLTISTPAADAGDSFSGRDFGGMRFPLAAVDGPLAFSAAKVWNWTDESPTTRRMLLTGDVRVKLGLYEFAASRAVVWLERVEDEGQAGVPGAVPGASAYQVFIYFDRLGSSTGDAGVAVTADRLPVRAIVRAAPTLKADLVYSVRPPEPLVLEGEAALADTLGQMAGREPTGALATGATPATKAFPQSGRIAMIPGEGRPYLPPTGAGGIFGSSRSGRIRTSAEELANAASNLDPEAPAPIFAKNGLLTVSAGNIVRVSGQKAAEGASPTLDLPATEDAVMVSDGLVVEYAEARTGRFLQLSAQRGVIFLKPGTDTSNGANRFDISSVLGLYLEGDVIATDGRYTLRGPQIYYDVVQNKALVLDAVFWTYDQQRRLPLYVRAKTLRQESSTEFKAEHARLSATAFFEPQLSIGASSITISRKSEPATAGGAPRSTTLVDARNITLRAFDVPIAWAPRLSGDPTQAPLKEIRVTGGNEKGAIGTRWNAITLLGLEQSPNREVDLLLDYYFKRGPAIGSDWAWKSPDGFSAGSLSAYLVADDRGDDLLKTGAKIKRDGETRGYIFGEQRWQLDELWSLSLEGSYISDEAFIDGFFEQLGATRREFTNRALLKRVEDNTYFAMEAKGEFNDFIANEYLLQSQGYNVDRMPEVTYVRQADDLIRTWGDRDTPGALQWFQEYRLGRLSLNFDEVTAESRGLNTPTLAERVTGIAPTETVAKRLRDEGYVESGVYRFDTRQELTSKLNVGPINVSPFVVARGTWWDNDFTKFSPNENDNARGWGQAGLRLSTEIQKVDNSVESRLLDLHRIRHIIEPSITASFAETNVDREDLPQYDRDVEGIAEGGIARIGLNQTWQTQRGGPGRWRSVDVFKLRTDYVKASGDVSRESPIGRFFEYRPELSSVGEFIDVDAVWQATNVLAITGGTVYDMDLHQPARTTTGFVVQHSSDFSSFAELRYLNAQDTTYLDFGSSYVLTSKYTVAWAAAYDVSGEGLQSVGADLRRYFQATIFGLGIGYNATTDRTAFSVFFQPLGLQSKTRTRLLDTEPEINDPSRLERLNVGR
ncbi:MAG: hypothetical protein SFY96_14685 [Planctomycetota bacterium]|nr:hypothetical protein [Planctomycetota bacterium]